MILYDSYVIINVVNIVFYIDACKPISYVTRPNRLLFMYNVAPNVSLT